MSPDYLEERPVHIDCGEMHLAGSFGDTQRPIAVALIAADCGSVRHCACELELARALRARGLSTLMVDVVTSDEQADPAGAARLRIDALALAHRIGAAREWIASQPELRGLPVAVIGEGGAGAAALIELAGSPRRYVAAVLRKAQPLRAGLALDQCKLPLLIVVDPCDAALLSLNREALPHLHGEVELLVRAQGTPSAEGQPSEIAALIARWLAEHLGPRAEASASPSPRCDLRPGAGLDH